MMQDLVPKLISFLGLWVMLGLAWLLILRYVPPQPAHLAGTNFP